MEQEVMNIDDEGPSLGEHNQIVEVRQNGGGKMFLAI